MRPRHGGGALVRTSVLLAVPAGALFLVTGPAHAARPTPKPTAHPQHGHATPTPTPTPTPTQSTPARVTTTPPAAIRSTPSVAVAVIPPKATVSRAAPALVPPAPAPRATRRRPAAVPPPSAHQRRRDEDAFSSVAHSLATVATTSPQLPLGLLGAVVLFLVVQNRIDRRDPKLAVTDATSSVELEFRPVRRLGPRPVRHLRVPLTISPVAGAIAANDIGLSQPTDNGTATT